MRRIIFLISITILLYSTNLLANYDKELSNSLLREANKLYENGDISGANLIYRRLAVEDNISSVDLYYNLATSYEALGNQGLAVLWYERVLAINPFDKEAFSRLSLLVEGYSNNLKIVFIIVHVFLYIFLLLFTLSAVLFILSVISIKYRIATKKLFNIALVLSSIFLIFTGISQLFYNKNYIVIVKENSALYKGNNLSSDSLKMLSEGSKLEILEEYDTWFYAKMKNGEKGWIYKYHSERI